MNFIYNKKKISYFLNCKNVQLSLRIQQTFLILYIKITIN